MQENDEPLVVPRIGDEVGDVMEADVPGCYRHGRMAYSCS